LSLNWREIDCVLAEIPLEGSIIREIHQPSHQSLVFSLYNRGGNYRLLVRLDNTDCRLHLVSHSLPSPSKPPRFVSFLRAHVRGGHILQAGQLGGERIVKLRIARAQEEILLWVRLWGGAPNLIATDAEGRILEVFNRRPGRGELAGGSYHPQAAVPAGQAEGDRYTVRSLPGEGSFNERLERYYAELEQRRERERLTSALTQKLGQRENRLLANLELLRGKLAAYAPYEQLKKCGDLILSHLAEIGSGDRWLCAADFADPERRIEVELDSRLSPAQNAESYYEKFRKAKSGYGKLGREIREQEAVLALLREKLARIPALQDLPALRSQARSLPKKPAARDKASLPGLSFRAAAFKILVGRTAKENDELLRRGVKGNDVWLHARDYPGAYVFIKTLPGKSVPPEVLLTAGSLALHYSKGKNSAQGDVYYTQVKYLRRVKNGPLGLVLPTREKNLFIRLEAESIEALKKPQDIL